MRKLTALVAFLFLIYASTAMADKDMEDHTKDKEPVDNGYPYFIAAAVFPQDRGLVEVIVAPYISWDDEYQDILLYPSVTYGVTDSWQVYYAMTLYDIFQPEGAERTSGHGDIDIGSQYSWMYIKKSTVSAAALINIHIPTADINKGLTDGLFRYEPSVVLAKDIVHKTWRTQFFAQVGLSIAQKLKTPSDPDDEVPTAHAFVLNTGIAARYEKINYSLELNWRTDTWSGGEDNELYATPGIYVQITDNIALGIGFPIGLSRDSTDFQIIGNLLVDIETAASKEDDDDDKDKKKKNKLTDKLQNRHRSSRNHHRSLRRLI